MARNYWQSWRGVAMGLFMLACIPIWLLLLLQYQNHPASAPYIRLVVPNDWVGVVAIGADCDLFPRPRAAVGYHRKHLDIDFRGSPRACGRDMRMFEDWHRLVVVDSDGKSLEVEDTDTIAPSENEIVVVLGGMSSLGVQFFFVVDSQERFDSFVSDIDSRFESTGIDMSKPLPSVYLGREGGEE